ncbi:MAG: mannose-1-phosphate guanylyltransferase/mannose-6-phosphate isomerase [Sphingopyxis sp.]
MPSPIIPVILSGGSGTRLWPLSTAEKPKQFLTIIGEHCMFRQTLERVADRTRFAAPMIVCGAGHIAHVEAELAAMGVMDARIIIEPAARNTAPAIALAALAALAPGEGDAQLLVMPSDHVMTDVPAFHHAIDAAIAAVENGALATFGIHPTSPETGYGYIAAGDEIAGAPGVRRVKSFVEKPQASVAEAMLAAGNHLWNAGIFLMRADRYMAELFAHAQPIAAACAKAMAAPRREGALLYPDAAAFLSCPAQSIDYAVMEKSHSVAVIGVDPGWSDVGSWSAIYDLTGKDAAGNAVQGHTLSIDADHNLIHAAEGLRIATLGVSGLVIVANGDDILVMTKDRAQDIKYLVEKITSDS